MLFRAKNQTFAEFREQNLAVLGRSGIGRPINAMKLFLRCLFTLCFLLTMRTAHAQTPADILAQADKAYGEKSYARALELYRAAKAAGPVREPEKVDYQIVQSLFKTQKWDEAISAANTALKTANWKARFYYVLGQLYVKAPKSAYKLGDRIWRQDEYPEVTGDQKPVQIYLGESDQKAALENLETAKVEAQRERDVAQRSRFFAPIYPLSSDEECDLNFDLAGYLAQTQFDEFLSSLSGRKEDKFDEVINVKDSYARGWSLPKKVLYLYAEIRALDQSDQKADFQRSLMAEGIFAAAYHQRMEEWANQYDDELKKQVKRPYPFNELGPLPTWNRLVNEFPQSDLAPQTQILVGQYFEQTGNLPKAVAAYRQLVAKFPQSKWVSDARAALRRIEAKEVSFNLQAPARPGQKPKFAVMSRNVKEIHFRAYKVKLENFLTQPGVLKDPNTQFTSFTQNFGKIDDAIKKFGAPVATWNFNAKDKGDYQGVSGELQAPITQLGAYAIVASAKGQRFAQIVLISDLALLKKMDKNGSFVYVADAKTGEAVNGANVVLKEQWYDGKPRVDYAQGQSNDAGFFDKKRRGDNESSVAAFAWVGDRYAMTAQQNNYWYENRAGNESRVLGTTDRPVYRPGQKVNFRQIVTLRVNGGDWQPVKARQFTVAAYNPKGEKFFEKDFTTNEFGSVSGDFTVPADAPLGQFSLNLTGGDSVSGGTQFRVEEYKRPEFEVTVTAPKEAKRPGETVAARINAKYYFGAPVPHAKVKYTVRKSTWWANYQFPTPYDWLYSSWGVGQYDTGRRNIGGEGSGRIVKEGEVTTDEQGYAELSFKTDALNDDDTTDWWSRYSNPLYTIEAEVTDSSRRTIEAQGEVKVARQQYFAFLNVERGYFQKGDRVPVELRTQDANDQPVAASGKMVVYKLLPGDKEEKVFEEAVATDATGRAFWNYEATDGGQFRIEYQATDAWNQKVKAQTEIWVVGDNIGAIRLRGVTILLDKRSYEEGDTLKARLVADKPGATVLFTQEAFGEVLRRDVLKIEGQSREVSIPIEKKHVPNFFLAAALVQDFEVYQAQTEVFVPPTRQLLDLKVTGDKATYKPGETGIFQIEARDWSGKPARAEVSLALIDASLFYIQKDYTPELRQFYYGERRSNTVNLDSNRSGNPEARSESDDADPNYKQHNWELPDDFGQLQLQPGGFTYYPFGMVMGGGGYYPRRRRMMARGGAVDEMASDGAAPMAPMTMAAPVAAYATASRSAMNKAPSGQAEAQAAVPPAQIRSNFAETAFWSPSVITEGGKATVKVTFPDSLTQWHATARGLTSTVQVGAAESDVATKKDLLVRLQAPRFFVEKDQVVISANVHNYTDKKVTVSVALQTDAKLRLASGVADTVVTLEPNAEQRVDWTVDAASEGLTTVQVTARAGANSDGVKLSFPVLVHGVQRFAGQSGTMPKDGKTSININFPKERRFGASQLNVQLNPSLGATMLDALPYLADYPYGCVEQTMSRFLPSVITERTLRDAGINLETLRARAKAYEAEAKAQPLGERVKNTGYSYPKGMPNARDLDEMASQRWWWGGRGSNNPVFDKAELDKMTTDGLNRLYSMQRSDGGWGWWPGSGDSDEYMSAYVYYGLCQAKAAGIDVDLDRLNRAGNYLNAQLKDEDNIHLLTYIAYALTQRYGEKSVDHLGKAFQTIVAGRLFEQRERLTPYSKALLAMTLFNGGEKEKAAVLVRNLENTVLIDAANGTAHYKTAPQWWYWWNNDVETNAIALRAFVQIDPSNKLTPLLMKWLTLQARGNHWRSTKETAEAVYTLAGYVSKFRELDVDYTLKVNLNDKLVRTYRVNKDNALLFDNRFIAGDLFLESGENKLTIEKEGRGNLYWNAYSEYFSLEEPIKASGNELDISRKFYKLTRVETKTQAPAPAPAAAAKVAGGIRIMPLPPAAEDEEKPEYSRQEIKDGETVTSGDLIEVELVVNAKNNYEYLVFEDMKAAGFEPVDIRSGSSYGDGVSSNVELRDDKVAFFVDQLPQGRRVLRYRVRAEVPGSFHALPTNGYAMYAPEVRAISDETRVKVKD